VHGLSAEEQKFLELVADGAVPTDIIEQQQEALKQPRVARKPLPGNQSASEMLISMRREEQF
jgi:hypothetical protein